MGGSASCMFVDRRGTCITYFGKLGTTPLKDGCALRENMVTMTAVFSSLSIELETLTAAGEAAKIFATQHNFRAISRDLSNSLKFDF